MVNLLNVILTASEKAANIARACRENQTLFSLLVEEKTEGEASTRFFQDFKTLADVLIQETIRHDVEQYFPVLAEHILGEESNSFTNTLGNSIEVKVCKDQNDTAKLLEIVLDGNVNAAKILAAEVHNTVQIKNLNIDNTELPSNLDIDIENLGLWIDPIDCTAEYIIAKESNSENGIYSNGLRCVTVLIGVYDKKTGVPLLGVINQPFYEKLNNEWKGSCYWGISTTSLQLSSQENIQKETKIIILSRIEKEELKSKLVEAGYTIIQAAGAGYKLLTVITGMVDAYIVSQGTTYRWDICGPHAILRSLGGAIYDYSKASDGIKMQIDYKDLDDLKDESKVKKYCNRNGLIAVRNQDIMKNIMHLLS